MALHEPGSFVIRGALLADPARRRAAPADVLVEDGIIRAVGDVSGVSDAVRELRADGMLMHPGLINAHTHGHGALARGQGDRWTLELLLAAAPWIGGGRALADKHLSARIAAAEMVARGCTAAYDLVQEFPLPTVEGLDAVATAYAEIGMRAVLAPSVADRNFYQSVPGLLEALPDDVRDAVGQRRSAPEEAILDAVEKVLRGWRWATQDIHAAVAPTVPLHCSDALMCGCARLSREHGVGLHSHVAESKVQALSAQRRYGRSLVAHLDELGLLNEHFTAAHAVWLDDDDLRRMADRGASLAHNPGSNMRLGNGMFPLRRALDLGVGVGLGTDGAHCSDNQNMYEVMRYASMLSKVQGPAPQEWASVEEVWQAATVGSAKSLGIPGIGAIAPGMKADIVFLSLESVTWIPHNWTVNQLVHSEDGGSVRHVMVGGRFIFRDGRHTTIDLRRLAAEAEAARARLEALNAEHHALFLRLEPVLSTFCPAFARQPHTVRRYLCDSPEPGSTTTEHSNDR